MLPVRLQRREATEEPFSLMRREFDRFFRRMWGDGWADEELAAYPVDIREDDDSVLVEAELPGFKRDEINVTLEQGVLRISAERKAEESKGTRHLTERRYTRIERAFTLPGAVDESHVEANLDNGVLSLRLPKTSEAKARRIEVK